MAMPTSTTTSIKLLLKSATSASRTSATLPSPRKFHLKRAPLCLSAGPIVPDIPPELSRPLPGDVPSPPEEVPGIDNLPEFNPRRLVTPGPEFPRPPVPSPPKPETEVVPPPDVVPLAPPEVILQQPPDVRPPPAFAM